MVHTFQNYLSKIMSLLVVSRDASIVPMGEVPVMGPCMPYVTIAAPIWIQDKVHAIGKYAIKQMTRCPSTGHHSARDQPAQISSPQP